MITQFSTFAPVQSPVLKVNPDGTRVIATPQEIAVAQAAANRVPIVLKLNPDGTHPTPVTPEERAAAQAALDRVSLTTGSQNWPSPNDEAEAFLQAFLRT